MFNEHGDSCVGAAVGMASGLSDGLVLGIRLDGRAVGARVTNGDAVGRDDGVERRVGLSLGSVVAGDLVGVADAGAIEGAEVGRASGGRVGRVGRPDGCDSVGAIVGAKEGERVRLFGL
jgi:hypothetical protein